MKFMIKPFLCLFFIIGLFTLSVSRINAVYKNHCWNCASSISSEYCIRCSLCGWYKCRNCGACSYNCSKSDNINKKPQNNNNNNNNNVAVKEEDGDSSFIWIILVGGAIAIGVYYYNKNKD